MPNDNSASYSQNFSVNPFNVDKEAGGSSGGEASLIGAGASPLGLGSDIGGSMRFPAAMCGICALRPTFGRHLSWIGVKGGLPYAAAGPVAVTGMMTKDIDSLVLSHKINWNANVQGDPQLVPIPFREDMFQSQK